MALKEGKKWHDMACGVSNCKPNFFPLRAVTYNVDRLKAAKCR